jgi:hypothetical protein
VFEVYLSDLIDFLAHSGRCFQVGGGACNPIGRFCNGLALRPCPNV